MPLLMPTSLLADGGRRLPAADRGRAVQRPGDRPAQPDVTSTATTAGSHDLEKVIQLAKPLFDNAPPDIFSDDPDGPGRRRVDDEAAARRRPEDAARPDPLPHRERRRPARRLLRVRHHQGLDRVVPIIGNKVGPMSQGSGLVLLYHLMGEQDGHHGVWGFHKGGNGGFTQVLQRAARGVRCHGEAGVRRSTTSSPRTAGRPGWRWPTARSTPRRSWSARSTRGVPSPSWWTRASCPAT